MAIIEQHASISPPVRRAVETCADTQSATKIDPDRLRRSQIAWQHWIDDKLMQWLQDPSQLDDDGIECPSGTILRLAIDYAEQYRDQVLPPPDSVVPDPNGGIVFERRVSDLSEILHFWDDGAVEFLLFRGTDLIARSPI